MISSIANLIDNSHKELKNTGPKKSSSTLLVNVGLLLAKKINKDFFN